MAEEAEIQRGTVICWGCEPMPTWKQNSQHAVLIVLCCSESFSGPRHLFPVLGVWDTVLFLTTKQWRETSCPKPYVGVANTQRLFSEWPQNPDHLFQIPAPDPLHDLLTPWFNSIIVQPPPLSDCHSLTSWEQERFSIDFLHTNFCLRVSFPRVYSKTAGIWSRVRKPTLKWGLGTYGSLAGQQRGLHLS